jgi:segregation and condensation protein A
VGELLSDVTLSRLQHIFRDLMKKQVDKIDPIRSKFGNIEKEKISLTDRMISIEEYAMLHQNFSFRGLLTEQHSKIMLIVTFLGILELMKVGKLKIRQENIFDEIMITYVPGVQDMELIPSAGE